MKREVRLFLFRHGETDWNAEGRFQGHLDVPLNETGRKQARELGRRLRDRGLEVIVASDLGRSIETARLVAQEIGLHDSRIVQEPGIKEAFLGKAQGLTLEEIRGQFGTEVLERWRSNQVSDADISYPEGETGAQVLTRVMSSIQGFVQRHPHYSRVGISTHGGVIRRFMHQIMTLTTGAPRQPIAIPNGVVYHVIYFPDSSGWQIVTE